MNRNEKVSDFRIDPIDFAEWFNLLQAGESMVNNRIDGKNVELKNELCYKANI